jgi:DNA-binding beta-propeller fold protein YncE
LKKFIALFLIIFLLSCCSKASLPVGTIETSISKSTIQIGSPKVKNPTLSPIQSGAQQAASSTKVAYILGSNGELDIVDLISHKVIKTITTGAAPAQNPDSMSVENSTAAIVSIRADTSEDSNALFIVNLATYAVSPPIHMNFSPVSVALNPEATVAWVTGSDGQLASVNTVTDKVIKTVNLTNQSGAYLDAISVTPNGQSLVVVDDGGASAGNLAYIINAASSSIMAKVVLTTDPGAYLDSMALSSNGQIAWIIDGGYGDGYLIPLYIPGAYIGKVVPVGGGPLAIGLDPSGTTAYIANGGTGNGNLIVPVTISSNIFQLPDSGGTPIAVSSGNNLYLDAIAVGSNNIYTLDRDSSNLFIISRLTGLIESEIAVSQYPVSLFVS